MKKEEKKNEDTLIVALAPLVFVMCCFSLAFLHATKGTVIAEFKPVWTSLIGMSWLSWAGMLCSATVMFFLGYPSFKKVAIASVLAVVNALLLVVYSSVFQINWLVMLLIMIGVVVPLSNAIFRKLGSTDKKDN